MWFTSSYGTIEIQMTKAQAESASHPGQCDADVLALSNHRKIRVQLERIDPKALRDELREYGAWSEEELADHEQNLQRILWIAAGNILENC
jgi:DNA-binding FadR family transcriptional regulator